MIFGDESGAVGLREVATVLRCLAEQEVHAVEAMRRLVASATADTAPRWAVVIEHAEHRAAVAGAAYRLFDGLAKRDIAVMRELADLLSGAAT